MTSKNMVLFFTQVRTTWQCWSVALLKTLAWQWRLTSILLRRLALLGCAQTCNMIPVGVIEVKKPDEEQKDFGKSILDKPTVLGELYDF